MQLVKQSAELIDLSGLTPEQRVERAGRCCYKSEYKIGPDTAPAFCRMLIRRGHESVIEHARCTLSLNASEFRMMQDVHCDDDWSRLAFTAEKRLLVSGNARTWRNIIYRLPHPVLIATMYDWAPALFEDLTGCPSRNTFYRIPDEELTHDEIERHLQFMAKLITDRGTTHMLVRHRHASFSQESQQFCDYASTGVVFVEPPAQICIDESWSKHMQACEKAYYAARLAGLPPELARDCLPNATKSELIMSATLRQWRWILKLRTATDDQARVRELMGSLKEQIESKYGST